MFTGLVVDLGRLVSLQRKPAGAVLTLTTKLLARDAAMGDSIAVNGVCLTVVAIRGDDLSFDLSDETLRSTNLGLLRPGDRINLEPSLRADGKLGGHFVTGHVDGAGRIRTKELVGDTYRVIVEAPEEVTGYLVEKGSVAVDGISLTVVTVAKDSFSVVIIPHTASVTTIGFKAAGDTVNLEADIIGKYVARFLRKGESRPAGGDTTLMDALTRAGYLKEDR
jgi:riboflavin synthase